MTQGALEAGCLRGKVAVITGAARGIGRATAIAFAREGADIVGLDICAPVDPRSGVVPSAPEDLEETGRLVRSAGRPWFGITLDQRSLPALRQAALRIEQEFGGIDILFANAGIQSFHPLLDMEDADWHITIDVNLTGTANAIRAFAPSIVKHGGGRIIVTSSTQGQHGTMLPAQAAMVSAPAVYRTASGQTFVYVGMPNNVYGYQVTVTGGVPQLSLTWTANIAQGVGTSPIVRAGVVYVSATNQLVALNATTRAVLGSNSALGAVHWQSPVVARGVVFCSDTSGNLTAFTVSP